MNNTPLILRFFAKLLMPNGIDGCWLWNGARAYNGYGFFWYEGKWRRATHFAYEYHTGSVPEGHNVLHHCDNPPCVNPDHLFTGTARDNALDAIGKNRFHCLPKIPIYKLKGLTVGDVHLIRESEATGASLATRFDVSIAQINLIKTRKRYTEVE